MTLQNQWFQCCPARVDGRREPGATRAKNYRVAYLCHSVFHVDCIRCRPPSAPTARHLSTVVYTLWAAADMMMHMANLTLIYGLRLLPEGEVIGIQDATLKLSNGHEAHVTMHSIEGSREEIETQLRRSLDAFFDFYPEI
jgi:hypothetical protein